MMGDSITRLPNNILNHERDDTMNKLWIASLGLGIVLAGIGPARVAAQDPPPPNSNPLSYGRPISSWVGQGLKDNDPGRRVKALYAIGRLGPEARVAIPDMVKQLGDEKDLSVRRAYAWALRQIDPRAATAASGR